MTVSIPPSIITAANINRTVIASDKKTIPPMAAITGTEMG
jgi:hypothetical protein